MTLNTPSLKTLASWEVAKALWNASFNFEVLQLQEVMQDDERKWEILLTDNRELAISNLNAYIRNMILPSCLKTPLTENILSLHRAYHQLVLWKIKYDRGNSIDLLQEGELYAPNYFTVSGEFDDVSWTKRFVMNSKYMITHRFSLASCYWFEDECMKLWTELNTFFVALIGENFTFTNFNVISNYFPHDSMIVLFRIIHLMNREICLAHPRIKVAWKLTFYIMTRLGYEHGCYYAWKQLSDDVKIRITRSNTFFESMNQGYDYPHDKITYFLYSQLNRNGKRNLLRWTIEHNDLGVLHTLLLSSCAKEIHCEIIPLFKSMPSDKCLKFLELLASRIKQLQLASHIKLFSLIWSYRQPYQKRYFARNSKLLILLAEAKLFLYIEDIITCLLNSEKDFLLTHNYDKIITGVLHILTKYKEFDFLEKYLYCLIVDTVSVIKQGILRKDSLHILQKFRCSDNFITWYREEISESEKQQVYIRLDCLETSIKLLNELCYKVSVQHCPNKSLSDFKTNRLEKKDLFSLLHLF